MHYFAHKCSKKNKIANPAGFLMNIAESTIN